MSINAHKLFCFAPSHYVLHKDIAYVMTEKFDVKVKTVINHNCSMSSMDSNMLCKQNSLVQSGL